MKEIKDFLEGTQTIILVVDMNTTPLWPKM
jgi:hypothetical protein